MPQQFKWGDFRSGWCPSDDAINGRKNALLRMDNVELGSNGALSLIGGTKVIREGYPAEAHTLYSRIINDVRRDYLALIDGTVYRDTSKLVDGGDNSVAAFGTAFNHTLICSGIRRLKDPGVATPLNLGIKPPVTAPRVDTDNAFYTEVLSPTEYIVKNYSRKEVGGTPDTIEAISKTFALFEDNEGFWTIVGSGTTAPGVGTFQGALGNSSSIGISHGGTITDATDIYLTADFSPAKDLSPGSTDPTQDTITFYVKHWYNDPVLWQGKEVPLAGLTDTFCIKVIDSAGRQVNFKIIKTDWKPGVWQEITLPMKVIAGYVGMYIPTNGIGFMGDGDFDWTKVSTIEFKDTFYGKLPSGARTADTFYISGGIAKGIKVIPGTPAPAPHPVIITKVTQPYVSSDNVVSIEGLTENGVPLNWDKLVQWPGSSNTADGTPLDYFTLYITAQDGGDVTDVNAVEIDVYFSPPTSGQDNLPRDYASYLYENIQIGQTINLKLNREQFEVSGNPNLGWKTVYGIRITFDVTNQISLRVVGSVIPNNNIPINREYFGLYGGKSSIKGTVTYAQMNVSNNGSYTAKSVLSPISSPISLDTTPATVYPEDPTSIDSQVNEVWVFRRGGTLDEWYRVKVLNATTGYLSFSDKLNDDDARVIGITVNLNLISIAADSVTEKILEIIGPVQGRWYYFTDTFMYPSDINDPDLVDNARAIRICGSASEKFMWAKSINESVILVGTSVNIYLLTGTFITLPDTIIDVYYRPLSVKYPPITRQAKVYEGLVYYLSNDGWRVVDAQANNKLLTAPNTDRLYQDEDRYGYTAADLNFSPGIMRFPIEIAKNKLWCFITGTGRCEVWDFIRQYWRTFDYNLGDVSAVTSTQDGKILAYYSRDNKLREIDITGNRSVDEVTNQFVNILSFVFDGDNPKNRKDTYTLKFRGRSGNGSINIALTKTYDDGHGTTSVDVVDVGDFTSSLLVDMPFDISLSVGLCKTWQIQLTGAVSDFVLDDITIDFDLRPPQVSRLYIPPTNYGSAGRKRVYKVPFTIDTLGNNVDITPVVDGVAQPSLIVNSTYKKSFVYRFPDISGLDVLKGIDYGYYIHSSIGLFEFFGFDNMEGNVELFPIQTNSYVIPVTNFGSDGRKRFRMWPFMLDTLGATITFTPIIDGVAQTPVYFTCNGKQVVHAFELVDAIGTNFSGCFSGGTFELWNIGQPKQIEIFPDPNNYYYVPITNFGSVARKRLRMWPFVINTLGEDVTFTPVIDGVNQPDILFNTTDKKTVYVFETSDVIGVDFSGFFWGNKFELWEIGQPKEIEVFPEPLKYFKIPVTNLGSVGRKRIRLWPFIFDALGNDIIFTPIVDGVEQTPVIFNNNGKKTVYAFETDDKIGTDFSGTFSGTRFELWSIEQPKQIEVFPDPVKYYKIPVTNLGSPNKKRARVWPFILDPLGHDVSFKLIVDGTDKDTVVFNHTGKKTIYKQITTDIFGVDFSGVFSSNYPFELWQVMSPESVQILPIAKRFDQVGPEELFKYGRIKQFELRVLPNGGTTIPYNIYFNDNSVLSDNITVADNIEASYFIDVPKGTSGNIVRIELGPTTFDFHRFYMRILVMLSGKDTENKWVTLGISNG